jgi:hypothetical protein
MSKQKPINLSMSFEGPPTLFQRSEENAVKEAQLDKIAQVSGQAARSVLHLSGAKRPPEFEDYDSGKSAKGVWRVHAPDID